MSDLSAVQLSEVSMSELSDSVTESLTSLSELPHSEPSTLTGLFSPLSRAENFLQSSVGNPHSALTISDLPPRWLNKEIHLGSSSSTS